MLKQVFRLECDKCGACFDGDDACTDIESDAEAAGWVTALSAEDDEAKAQGHHLCPECAEALDKAEAEAKAEQVETGVNDA